MIALTEFDRLEAPALWRADKGSQRVEVIVSLGEATLTLTDFKGHPLTHWSLPAVERVNPTAETPAIYRPAPDSEEEIEVEDELLIEALARIRRAIERGGPHPGRLRGTIMGTVTAAAIALAVLWLPGALIRQAVATVPDVTRTGIGTALQDRISRLSGNACHTEQGDRALSHLETRLMPEGGKITVLRSGVALSQHLPGGIILLNRALVEDPDRPEVTAGYVLAEIQRGAQVDPLERLLRDAGLMTSLRLLTTGHIPAEALDAHAETLLTAPQTAPDTSALITRFAEAQVPTAPYGYAVDITGQTTLTLIEADGTRIIETRPTLSDGDWVALQGICEE